MLVCIHESKACARHRCMLRACHNHSSDQFFSVIATVLARQKILETPADFMRAILENMKYPRPQGRKLHAKIIHATRDWQAYLGGLNMTMGGLTKVEEEDEYAHAMRFIPRRCHGLICPHVWHCPRDRLYMRRLIREHARNMWMCLLRREHGGAGRHRDGR